METYINTQCAKHKDAYGFQGDLNPLGYEGFIIKGIYTIANQIVSFSATKLRAVLSLATKLPSNGYSSNSQQ